MKDDWFIDDGIHYTTQGYRARSKDIANALLNAFPAGAAVDNPDNADCLVSSTPGEAETVPEGEAAAEAASTTDSTSTDPTSTTTETTTAEG